ncbi:hypothetical protein [Brevundimonas naejangsanensis]|uniref:hypothetical protein n=1 Tax=Brevundimonas naejangsanensis TaxID=588932 RepID=UPI0013C4A2AE|nr:hypothetical protein [Brevundimonas naejangsanensis]
MRLPLVSLFAALSLGLASAVQAAPDTPTPQVEAWPLQQTGAIGASIFFQDRAAWRATDVLLAHLGGATDHGLIGWIVVEQGDAQLVRFVRGDPAAPRPGYDILVDKTGRPGPAVKSKDVVLPDDQIARYLARATALANIGALRCTASFNPVVLDDPDGDGWLVWLLAATNDVDVVPMGGHYRFHLTADGRTVEKREQLSSGCLNMDRRKAGQSGQPAALFTTVLVASQPLEVHVFLSLLNRLPIYVGAGDKIWSVEGAAIREIDASKER